MKRKNNLLKLVVLSMLIALGVVISPILRVEGMCPMAHLINIVCSVLLGPWYSLICATLIGIIRMAVMGIPPLALTGAVFGAFLSGVFYRLSKGKIIFAVLGEVIGTGIIGAVVSYPVMRFIWGREGLGWVFYIPSFIAGTLIGGSIAYFFLRKLASNGMLGRMQKMLGTPVFADAGSVLSNALTIAAFGAISFVVIEVVAGMFKLSAKATSYTAYGSMVVFACAALIYFIIKKLGGNKVAADK
ncbi:MAG: energy coupling factor transporter S component ThiW [Ruminococcus sp.]|nr:energy coupling factor transporter S component ThiW [Ruminococcus sp.]